VTFYGSYMVDDLPKAADPAPAPVPGRAPGAVPTSSDQTAVMTVAQRMRAMYPRTAMDFGDEAPAPVPGSAPLPGDGASPPPLSPEAAAYTFDLPEGFTADPAQLGELKSLAVKHALAPEVAGELVALHARTVQAQEAARREADAGLDAKWKAEAEALPEMRRDGGREAARLASSVAPPETIAFLEQSGLGNHPAFVRWAVAVGREIARLRGLPAGTGQFRATPGMRD